MVGTSEYATLGPLEFAQVVSAPISGGGDMAVLPLVDNKLPVLKKSNLSAKVFQPERGDWDPLRAIRVVSVGYFYVSVCQRLLS